MHNEKEYVVELHQRLAKLENNSVRIKHAQDRSARQRDVERTAWVQEIQQLHEATDALDQELHALASDLKSLITKFQGVGMQAQLATLQERTDMLHVEQWVTKKELKKIISS